MNRATQSALLTIAAALLCAACHSDGLYDPCPLSNSITEACDQVPGEGLACTSDAECEEGLSCVEGRCADGTAYTCVVAEHPFCLEEICASWEGAEALCTRACENDDDCPGLDRCKAHNGIQFCVPADLLSDWSPFEQTQLLTEGEACGQGVPCDGANECCPAGSEKAGFCAAAGTCGEATSP